MVILAKDPSGKNVFKSKNVTSSSTAQRGTTSMPLSVNSSEVQKVHSLSTPVGTMDSAK